MSVRKKTEVASLRVPRGTMAKLKRLAHMLSLERGRDVTWCEMVRELLDEYLVPQGEEQRQTIPG